jgi:hypothetical protein
VLIAFVKVRTSRAHLHFHQNTSVQSYWLHLDCIHRDVFVDQIHYIAVVSSSKQNHRVGDKNKTPKSEHLW